MYDNRAVGFDNPNHSICMTIVSGSWIYATGWHLSVLNSFVVSLLLQTVRWGQRQGDGGEHRLTFGCNKTTEPNGS